MTLDWDDGINFSLEVSANRTLANPTNGQPGTHRQIFLDGDSTTARTLTFGSQYGGITPTLADITNTKQYVLTIMCITPTHFVVTAIDGSAP